VRGQLGQLVPQHDVAQQQKSKVDVDDVQKPLQSLTNLPRMPKMRPLHTSTPSYCEQQQGTSKRRKRYLVSEDYEW
jgi:hypothetical protein